MSLKLKAKHLAVTLYCLCKSLFSQNSKWFSSYGEVTSWYFSSSIQKAMHYDISTSHDGI